MSRTKIMNVDSPGHLAEEPEEDDVEGKDADTDRGGSEATTEPLNEEENAKPEDSHRTSNPNIILPLGSQVCARSTLNKKDADLASVAQRHENTGETGRGNGEPPMDWLEPLEDDEDGDDTQSWETDCPWEQLRNGSREAEVDSLAGESERSGSVAGSERNYRKRAGRKSGSGSRRGKQAVDEDWVDWPILGEGWKRKVVFRRSGFSVGQSDTYYMSPKGDRVRSRIELVRTTAGLMDLTYFDFKTGTFLDVAARKRRVKRSRRETSSPADCGFSSESSFPNEGMDQGDRDYSPDTQFIVGQSVHLRPSSSHSHKDDNGRVVSLVRHSTRAMPDIDQPGPYLSQLDPSLTPVSPASGTVKQSGSPQDADGLRSNPRHPTSPGPRLLSGDSALLVNGNTRTLSHISFQPCLCICNRCKNSFTGMEGQTLCRRCSHTFKSQDNRNITFRKWLPCGQCRACQVTQDCGSCASCRNGRLNPESRKPVRCRKRKCLCPIRKNRADDLPLVTQVNILNSIPQCSDSEDFSVQFDDDDDDDGDDDDDEGGPKKRSRRSCGTCEACVCTKDCGTCDFCMDKPKFGGSNRKRQKCRLRQCQREAMRHLLPFELGQSEVLTHEVLELSKPRSYYLYTRKGSPHSSKGKLDFEFSDNEADHEMRSKGSLVGLRRQEEDRLRNSSFNGQISKRVDAGRMGLIKEKYLPGRGPETSTPPLLEADIRYKGSDASLLPQNLAYQSEHAEQRSKGSSESVQWTRETEVYTGEQHEEGTTPMITQIFSLADDAAAVNGIDLNHELLQLLESLRSAVLPVLWFSIMVEGPRLQLLQCSKLSTMADTVLQIEPSFCYHISVQGQPLLPTHPLYERHPRRLTSVAQVVALLLELEKYAVCQGFAPREPVQGQDPLVYERAATCDFLVPQKAERCASCMHPSQRH